MEDPNSIAWLRPVVDENQGEEGKYTWMAMRLNMLEDIPPQRETIFHTSRSSRQTTAPLEDDPGCAQDKNSYPAIHLQFNPGPKGNKGFMFGTSSDCDVRLPRLGTISRHHCVLKFDDQRRLILRDSSTNGTIVCYDNKGGATRRHFTWILGGHEVPRDTKEITIQLHHHIKFQITVSTHDGHTDLYNDNVDIFEMGALGLRSAGSTIAPTERPQEPIRLEQQELGHGTFGVVRHFWDVSTGEDFAYKEPHENGKYDLDAWKKEADIMKRISHDHVVKLLEASFDPRPRLVLEYVPFGTLEDLLKEAKFSFEECLTVLRQGLSALEDLHEREEPIVHRDIKPGNILIKSLDPIHIKLSDFGISKASVDLATICGTLQYLAPEIHEKAEKRKRGKKHKSEKYTPVVDIWSFGVVVFQCANNGLPVSHASGRDWCEKIVEQVKTLDFEDLMNFLSTAMLVMDPKLRFSAKDCYQKASQISVPSQDRCLTPRPASYAERYASTVVYNTVEGQESECQSNLPVASNDSSIQNEALAPRSTRRSSQHENSIQSSDILRYITSGVLPSESNTSRKRLTRSPTPPTLSERHNRRPRLAETDPEFELFGQDWLLDPNCVGSSVAAMGAEEPSSISSWEDWET